MPSITLPGSTRRSFLLTSLGAVVLAGRPAAAAASTRWALLADTHIGEDPADGHRGFRPQDNLRKVLPGVLGARPDGIVIAGDVARLDGKPGDYRVLSTLLEPAIQKTPVCMALGNHDHRDNFLAVFGETAQGRQSVARKHVLVVERAPVRLVLLDSLLAVNLTPGLLGRAQRAWLAEFLERSDNTPTLLVVHHTLDDGDGSLLDVDRMMHIVAPHRKVKAIVYGHSHRYHFGTHDGIHLLNLPAVGYNFNDTEPVGWVEAALTAEAGSFKLHAVLGNTADDGKVTTLRWRA
jgi:3',5'-cyclic-AMP phosphodiesterase